MVVARSLGPLRGFTAAPEQSSEIVLARLSAGERSGPRAGSPDVWHPKAIDRRAAHPYRECRVGSNFSRIRSAWERRPGSTFARFIHTWA